MAIAIPIASRVPALPFQPVPLAVIANGAIGKADQIPRLGLGQKPLQIGHYFGVCLSGRNAVLKRDHIAHARTSSTMPRDRAPSNRARMPSTMVRIGCTVALPLPSLNVTLTGPAAALATCSDAT